MTCLKFRYASGVGYVAVDLARHFQHGGTVGAFMPGIPVFVPPLCHLLRSASPLCRQFLIRLIKIAVPLGGKIVDLDTSPCDLCKIGVSARKADLLEGIRSITAYMRNHEDEFVRMVTKKSQEELSRSLRDSKRELEQAQAVSASWTRSSNGSMRTTSRGRSPTNGSAG